MADLGCSTTERNSFNKVFCWISFRDWRRRKVSSMRKLDGQFRVKMDLKQDMKERNGLDWLIL
jgi:hypothetical protein